MRNVVQTPLDATVNVAVQAALSAVRRELPAALQPAPAGPPQSHTREGDDGAGGIITIAPFTIGISLIGGPDAIFSNGQSYDFLTP